MRTLGWVGLAYLYAVSAVAGIPALLNDNVFYFSDIFSLSVVVLTASLIVFPIVGLIAFALSRLPERARRLTGRWVAFIAAVGIVDIFLALFTLYLVVTLYLVDILNWTWLKHFIKNPIFAAIFVFGGCLLPAGVIVYMQSDKDGLIERVKHVGSFALVMALLLIGYSVLSSHGPAGESERGSEKGRHLAFIVLDGWPSQYLHAYNPEAPANAFDEVLGDARVYLGAHTSFPHTHQFFGTLYNGDTKVLGGDWRGLRSTKSLGARLQARNVGVRFMNYHRSGIPDSSAANRSDHEGLRSYFLTERYYWIPQALGLDYHIALSGPSIAKNFKWFLPRALVKAANPSAYSERENALTEVLIPELRRMRQKHRMSFTLFHSAWARLGRNSEKIGLLDLPGAQKVDPNETAMLPVDEIRANNYRYDPKFEPLVELRRQIAAIKILRQGKLLREFITALRADPILSDTVVVLTADHGTMYAKGRLWYSYHPNRENVRVPLIVFDSGMKGKDDQLLTTPALSRAIDNFFVRRKTSPRFEPTASADSPALTLVRNAKLFKEWYLVATYPDKAYWINLHPDGPGKTLEMKIDGYRQTEIARFDGAPPELAMVMKDILRSFGIDREDVHRAFR